MKKVIKNSKLQRRRVTEIEKQISMTSQQRQQMAKMLKGKIYGKNPPDVREYHRRQKLC